MADEISGIIKSIIPTKAGTIAGTSNTFFWITILILIIIFLIIGGVIIWIVVRSLQFNKKIDVYEDRGTYLEKIKGDRAKEIVYNAYGDSVFYLKRRHKTLPRGEKKIGAKTYAYVIRQDGEWVNVDLSYDNGKLTYTLIHPDMRAFKSGMGKLIKERYEKKSFLKKYGGIIIPFMFLALILLGMYFIIDRIVASEDNLLQMTVAAQGVMDKAGQVLSAVNGVCSGSGLKT
jgi:hypothetical protein